LTLFLRNNLIHPNNCTNLKQILKLLCPFYESCSLTITPQTSNLQAVFTNKSQND